MEGYCKNIWQICILYLFIFAGNLSAHKRKLSANINPGCESPECDTKRNETASALLVHVTAVGDNDTLHHIWDFTKAPSLLIARTSLNTSVNVTWDKYLRDDAASVSFSQPPFYVFGAVFDKVFEFNDAENVGTFNASNRRSDYVHVMDAGNFHWKLGSQPQFDNDTALISIDGVRRDHTLNKTGIIRISMGAYGGGEHSVSLPHLLHSSNSSQVDVAFDHMPTKFENSRFGMSFVVVSSDPPNSTTKLNVRQSLDDEHDPGVFSIIEIMSPEISEKQPACEDVLNGGYLQWRPVVYTSESRDATNSVDSVQYNVTEVADVSRLNGTLFYKVFGARLAENLITTTNVTFGGPGDKYYNKANYASWTFVAGVGRPAEETFSMLVILILAIGLGLPLILIVFGVICVFMRRIMKNKDDLFLSL